MISLHFQQCARKIIMPSVSFKNTCIYIPANYIFCNDCLSAVIAGLVCLAKMIRPGTDRKKENNEKKEQICTAMSSTYLIRRARKSSPRSLALCCRRFNCVCSDSFSPRMVISFCCSRDNDMIRYNLMSYDSLYNAICNVSPSDERTPVP